MPSDLEIADRLARIETKLDNLAQQDARIRDLEKRVAEGEAARARSSGGASAIVTFITLGVATLALILSGLELIV